MADGEAAKILEAMDALVKPLKALMIRSISMSIELAPHFAKLAKIYYDEYVKLGFSPEQALDLTKHGIDTAKETAKAAVQK